MDPAPAEFSLRSLIQSDLRVWAVTYGFKRPGQRVDGFTALRMVARFPGLRAGLLQRLAYAAHRRRIWPLPLLLVNLNLTLHGFEMPAYVPVGPGLYIAHPVGTVVTADRLGANVSLISGVTVGMRTSHAFPTIGDDVYIGAGARVLGGITIGDRVQVGANAVVLTDVPAGSVAVGVPATVHPARHEPSA